MHQNIASTPASLRILCRHQPLQASLLIQFFSGNCIVLTEMESRFGTPSPAAVPNSSFRFELCLQFVIQLGLLRCSKCNRSIGNHRFLPNLIMVLIHDNTEMGPMVTGGVASLPCKESSAFETLPLWRYEDRNVRYKLKTPTLAMPHARTFFYFYYFLLSNKHCCQPPRFTESALTCKATICVLERWSALVPDSYSDSNDSTQNVGFTLYWFWKQIFLEHEEGRNSRSQGVLIYCCCCCSQYELCRPCDHARSPILQR